MEKRNVRNWFSSEQECYDKQLLKGCHIIQESVTCVKVCFCCLSPLHKLHYPLK